MPDSASLDMGAPSGGGGKGVPSWVMVVGAVAGVVGLVLLLKGQGGGGGTTAAGTSINAALGSIQEENMNLLGTTQAGFMQTTQQFGALSNQVAGGFGQTSQQIADTQNQMQAGFASMSQQIAGGFTSTQDQINSGFAGQTANSNNNTMLISSQLQQEFDALTSQMASGQQLTNAQYGEMLAIQTNPWVKQLYQNQIATTLDPQTQKYYWNAVEQVANTGHIGSASIGSY